VRGEKPCETVRRAPMEQLACVQRCTMRLTELNPRFFALVIDDGLTVPEDCATADGAHGVTFDFPNDRAHRATVYFGNPVGVGPCANTAKGHHRGSGMTAADLSLSPSVLIRTRDDVMWHGYITGGDVIEA
jgi:hypothetical protein